MDDEGNKTQSPTRRQIKIERLYLHPLCDNGHLALMPGDAISIWIVLFCLLINDCMEQATGENIRLRAGMSRSQALRGLRYLRSRGHIEYVDHSHTGKRRRSELSVLIRLIPPSQAQITLQKAHDEETDTHST
jgi:hypothetical protein